MEQINILSGGAQSCDARNDDKSMMVDMEQHYKKFIFPTLRETIDVHEQYLIERASCDKYRLMLTINPFCSNVLFNACTEVIKNEGEIYKNNDNVILDNRQFSVDGNNVYGLYQGLTRSYMIQNTEYSNGKSGDIKYLPGLDIFNNHLLRNKSFRIVNPLKEKGNNNPNFNTINDNMRKTDGSDIQTYLRHSNKDSEKKDKHLYDREDMLTMVDGESIRENLRTENGWYGFYNNSTISAKEGNRDLGFNRVINNKGNCQFIDMYPDRTLYSFVPKYNDYRDRMEYNWDITLTYPFEHCVGETILMDRGNEQIEVFKEFDIIQSNDFNGLYIVSAKYVIDGNGRKCVLFRTLTRHNLQMNDKINLYFSEDENETQNWTKCSKSYIVSGLGNLENKYHEYYFMIHDRELLDDIFSTPRHKKNDGTMYSSWEYIRDYFYEVLDTSNLILDNGELSVDYNDYGDDGLTTVPDIDDYLIKVGDKYYILYNHDQNKKFDSKKGSLESEVDKFIRDIINNAFQTDDGDDSVTPTTNSVWKDYIQFRMRKVIGNYESEYYVRKFKKLPNVKNAIDKEDDLQFDKTDYQLGFANTIYGDTISQMLFTDSIKTMGIKDNLGRDLHEIFVTIVKRNEGNDEWENIWKDEDLDDINYENIEFSHCFGNVSCGFNYHREKSDSKVIRDKCHAMVDVTMINNNGIMSSTDSKQTLNDKLDIKINDEWFYGDIVEFNVSTCMEYVLSDVNFRFNTLQREKGEDIFFKFTYDEILCDDYESVNGFKTETKTVSNMVQRPEGYYYKPHYSVNLMGLTDVKQDSHYQIHLFKVKPIQNNGIFIEVNTRLQHRAKAGEKVLIVDKTTDREWTVDVVSVIDKYNFIINVLDKFSLPESEYCDWFTLCSNLNTGLFTMFLVNESIPKHAIKVSYGTYLWRDVIQPWYGENILEIPEYVFTNNHFYVDKSINFYLKRQDPYGVNGLYKVDKYFGDVEGKNVEKSSIYEYQDEYSALC